MVIWLFHIEPQAVCLSCLFQGLLFTGDRQERTTFPVAQILCLFFFKHVSSDSIKVENVWGGKEGFTLALTFCEDPLRGAYSRINLLSHSCHGEGLINMDAILLEVAETIAAKREASPAS